eukprot:242039-Amorphochlora_amoeboformis.AAC.1
MAMRRVHELAAGIPSVLAGDFNFMPNSECYQLITTGTSHVCIYALAYGTYICITHTRTGSLPEEAPSLENEQRYIPVLPPTTLNRENFSKFWEKCEECALKSTYKE